MHIAIIGNGITGVTAARTIRKLDPDCRISIISSESKYFYSRTALMYIYMGHMTFNHTKPYEDNFWEKNRLDLIFDHVDSVDFEKRALILSEKGEISFDKLFLATGSKSNKFNVPGIDLEGVQGLYSYQDLEKLERNTHPPKTNLDKQRVKNAVIVGGGLIGVELAEMLISRNIEVTFLIREKRFWGSVLPQEEAELIHEHLKMHGVNLIFEEELKEINSDEEARVKEIVTSKGLRITCEFVGLTIGVSPNIEFLKNTKLEINRGIVVNRYFETNIEGVFAAGDCCEFKEPVQGRKSVEQVWYTGRIMGEVVGKNILGNRQEYNPGPWFNSAKFFDIEYQTYGNVGNKLLPGESMFYFESQDKKNCLKLVFQEDNMKLLGVNSLGFRLRHEIIEKMLEEEKSVVTFVENWKRIHFNPEFSENYEMDIFRKFNQDFHQNLKIRSGKWKLFT